MCRYLYLSLLFAPKINFILLYFLFIKFSLVSFIQFYSQQLIVITLRLAAPTTL